MKKIIIIFTLFSIAAIKAQDLIVTQKNDSINGNITKETKSMLYFDFMKKGKFRSTIIPVEDIKAIKKDFYKTSEIPENRVKNSTDKKVRFALNAGFGYRLGKNVGKNSIEQKHIDGLKFGLNLDTDVTYMISEYIGLGVKYNNFSASDSNDNVVYRFDNDPNDYIGIETNNSINYVAPYLLTKYSSANEKNAFILGFSIGYINYNEEFKSENRTVTTKGGSVGFNMDLGYDFGITENISFGLQASLTSGVLNKVKIDQGQGAVEVNIKETLGEGLGLGRIALSAGLRCYL